METRVELRPATGLSVRENDEGILEVSAICDWRLKSLALTRLEKKRKSPHLQWMAETKRKILNMTLLCINEPVQSYLL